MTLRNLVVHLSTSNDEAHIPDMIDIFDEMKEDLEAHGIEFTYDFKADRPLYRNRQRLDHHSGRGKIFEKKAASHSTASPSLKDAVKNST